MDILNTLFEITVYSVIIVIATMLLKAVFKRRMSPRLHYAVWVVLMLRLMLPVTVESGFHVFTTPPSQAQTVAMPQAQTGAASAEPAAKVIYGYQPKPVKGHKSVTTAASPVAKTVPVKAQPLSSEDILLIIWLSGVGVSVLYIIILYATLRCRVRKNAALPSARLLALFEQVKAEMNIRAHLKLVCQYTYGTPALLLPRTVLMPVDTLVALDDEQIRFALRHELTHYRHRDHVTCLLVCLLNAVYWFNPFVWLAFRQMRTDMEVACDGAVVKSLDMPKKSRYASLIVKLFAQTDRRQLVLGMAQGDAKKIAEQRVRGIFKDAKSHASVKFVSALAAVLLLVTCFTTACQPTPETPPVNNKNTSVVEEVVQANAEENKEELETQKEVIAEQIKKVNGHMEWELKPNDQVTIKVDADIIAPEFDHFPVVRIKPKNFSQEQFELFADYLTDGSQLYYSENNGYWTREEIIHILVKLKEYYANKDLPKDIKNGLKWRIDMFEEELNTPKEKAEETGMYVISHADERPYTGELVTAENNSRYSAITNLKSYMNGEIMAVHLNLYQSFNETSSQMVFEKNDGFHGYNTFEPYEGIAAERLSITYEEAKAKAEDLVRTIDGIDSNMVVYDSSIAYEIGYFTNYTTETSPQAYSFKFARCYNGVVVKPIGYLWGSSDDIDYDKQVSPESILITIDDKGIDWAGWLNHTEYIEDVSDDSPLLDFETIQTIFEEHCSQKFAWVPRDDSLPPNQHVTLTVKKIELNLMPIPEKDNLDNYITVPVWDFIADMTYDKEVYSQEGSLAEGQKNVSIVTVNAINGTIINREQGY